MLSSQLFRGQSNMNSYPPAFILYSDLHGIILVGFDPTLGYDKKLPLSSAAETLYVPLQS